MDMADDKEKIKEEEWLLVRNRILAMPSYMRLSIGSHGPLDKNAIIKHIDKKDEIGAVVVKMQLSLLRSFKEKWLYE